MNFKRLPCQFPVTHACTPAGTACDHPDRRFPVDHEVWNTPTWNALLFQVNEPHAFRYCFESKGTLAAAEFTVSAHADLDCDGVWSTFRLSAKGDPKASMSGCASVGRPTLHVDKKDE